jgi:hypothetical protein
LPNTLLRKGVIVMGNKDIIERFNIKHPFLGRGPTQLVSTTPPRLSLKEYNNFEKCNAENHLPIMRHSKKINVLMSHWKAVNDLPRKLLK